MNCWNTNVNLNHQLLYNFENAEKHTFLFTQETKIWLSIIQTSGCWALIPDYCLSLRYQLSLPHLFHLQVLPIWCGGVFKTDTSTYSSHVVFKLLTLTSASLASALSFDASALILSPVANNASLTSIFSKFMFHTLLCQRDNMALQKTIPNVSAKGFYVGFGCRSLWSLCNFLVLEQGCLWMLIIFFIVKGIEIEIEIEIRGT